MFRLNLSLWFILVFGLFSHSVQSLMFELQAGQAKCISEDLRKNTMTVGNYSIFNPHADQLLPDSQTINVWVSSRTAKNNHLYHQSEHVQSAQFAFVAIENGHHIACFWAVVHKKSQITLTIDFDWRTGVAAHGWSKVAKKSHIDAMVHELQILQEVVSSIHEETIYLRKQEEEMELQNWTTTACMLWLSWVSLAFCISVVGLQLRHLKTFFKKMKIL